jgi:hypothetical protein
MNIHSCGNTVLQKDHFFLGKSRQLFGAYRSTIKINFNYRFNSYICSGGFARNCIAFSFYAIAILQMG